MFVFLFRVFVSVFCECMGKVLLGLELGIWVWMDGWMGVVEDG